MGVHLEGPFISQKKKGAHPPHLVHDAVNVECSNLHDVYGSLEDVAIVTLAPEFDKSGKVIKKLVEQGIVVSLGHSEAGLAIGENAVNNGANFITHLFNAMLPFHHRDPGLVGLLTSQHLNRNIYYGIIADGIHTHYAALKIAFKTNPNGLILVTDAMSAMGMIKFSQSQIILIAHFRS